MKEFIKSKYSILIPTFLVIVLLIALILYINEYKENRYANMSSEEVYQYFSGIKLEYKANIGRNRKKVVLKYEPSSEVVNLDNVPIYLNGKDRVIFPKEMSLFMVLNDKQYQVSSLSEIYKKNDLYYLRYKNVNNVFDYSFLYDGGNLYFFLDEVSVNINDREIVKLSPLSYINCSYQNFLEYYDKEKDEFKSIDLKNSDIVTVTNDYMTVDVTMDKVVYKNGFTILNNDFSTLIKLVDTLKNSD